MVIVSLLAAIITIVFREAIAGLGRWGYLGAFIISLISSATILFPAPGGAAVVLMGRDFNPYALGVASGMACLHAQRPPMLHHDLKSGSVLIFGGAGGAV